MARAAVLFCLCFMLSFAVYSQNATAPLQHDFDYYYRQISAFGKPYEASSAEKRIISLVNDLARSHGFTTSLYQVENQSAYHSFSDSLRIKIPGRTQQRVGLQVPVSEPEGHRNYDSAIGPALACVLIDRLSDLPPDNEVDIELLGAEDAISPGLGSRRASEDPYVASSAFILYLGLFDRSTGTRLEYGSHRTLSPLWLLNLALKESSKSGFPLSVPGLNGELQRLGVSNANRLDPYVGAGIPSIGIVSGRDSQESRSFNPGTLLDFVYGVLSAHLDVDYSNASNASWDRNYYVLNFASSRFILSEAANIALLLTLSGLSLSLVLAHRGMRRRYLKSVLRNFPAALLFIALLFISFGSVSALILSIHGGTSALLELESPLLFAGKLALTILVFAGLFRICRPLFPRQSNFYAGSAFVFSLASVVIASFFSVFAGLWVALGVVLVLSSSVFRSRIVKAILVVGAAFVIFFPLFSALVSVNSPSFREFLVVSPLTGDFFLTLCTVPLFLLIRRQYLLIPRRGKRAFLFRRILFVSLIVFGLVSLAASRVLYTESIPISDAVSIERRWDSGGDELRIAKNGSFSGLSVIYEGRTIPISGGTQIYPLLQNKAQTQESPPLTITSRTRHFLGRKTIRISVDGPSPLVLLECGFVSDEAVIVHSLNFPYNYTSAGSLEIYIGRNPPLPLTVEMTVPEETRGTVMLTSTSTESYTLQPRGASGIELPSRVVFSSSLAVE